MLARLSCRSDKKIVKVSKAEYETLAELRYSLRQFLHFSEEAAHGAGVTPQQHQALLAIKGPEHAAVLKQMKDGRFKVSARSRGAHDLSVVAAAFGGGGHRLAAGYTSAHGPVETIERLAATLRGESVQP